jgi:uncharacterized membrane protein
MSRITVGATVECSDGPAGELIALIIHPAKRTITHYVVRAKKDDVERMVPAEQVVSSAPDKLQLRCTRAELDGMAPFIKSELAAQYLPDPAATDFSYAYYYGYGIPNIAPADPQYVHVQSEQIPQGELAMRRGTAVHARDGHVGSVATLVVDDSGTISHFVVEAGHLGRRTELTLPLAAIAYVDDEGVHLKLDKAAVHSLPSLPSRGGGLLSGSYARMELVAKLFTEPDKAQQALDYLKDLTRSPGRPLKIREAAVLVRDADGTPRIVQSSQPSMAKGALVGAATGGLLTLLGPLGVVAGAAIGGGVGAVGGPKMDMGFPDAFLKRLETHLEPGQSALIVLVEHDYAQDLTDALAASDNVIGGQKLVDTLVQELLVETTPAKTGAS